VKHEGASDILISDAETDEDMVLVRDLMLEYRDSITSDLCFQDFNSEVASLPGKYAPPAGCLLLARQGSKVAGVVGMWPLGDGVCEMKRLYVRPEWRRTGLGHRLATAIMARAAENGYKRMVLDTLPEMTAARALYRTMGFQETDQYYANPIEGTLYMERHLIAD